MPTENQTDEERLNSFTNSLDSFKPEGFEEENWNKLKEAVVNFHKDDVQQLKINSVKIKNEKKELQDKYSALEASNADSLKQIETLNQQLKASQPEEKQKYFENEKNAIKVMYEKQLSDLNSQVAGLKATNAELERGVMERDILSDFNKAASDKNWIEGGRDYAQKVALSGIEFTRLNMPDGTVALIDKKTSKDVKTILNDFLGTDLGKSFIRSGTSGGGADGSASGSISGKRMTQAQYNALTPQEKMDRVLEGWQIV